MNLKKGVMYVFIANVINLIISLFTGFVLPKYLSIETYSSIKLFQLYITYIGILHLGFSDGMYLKYGGKSVAEINKSEVLSEFKTTTPQIPHRGFGKCDKTPAEKKKINPKP